MSRGLFAVRGGVRAEIQGAGRERFFNIAAQRELTVNRIEKNLKTGQISFWTTPKDFKQMKPIVKKTEVKLKVIERYGLPFVLYRNRRRKFLAVGFLLFFLSLYGMSFFIWDISFEGNHRFTDEMLLHFMETIPVTYGMKKEDISCAVLEGAIRNQFTEITWVSAEIRGTRLVIHVKENEALLAPFIMDETPCDLNAGKEGTITRTVIRSGICQVKAGDVVEKGTLLVSGTIPIYDDAGTQITSHEIHADAEIYAETIHTPAWILPQSRTIRARTGRIQTGFYIEIFGHNLYVLMPSSEETNREIIMEQKQLRLFESFYLPIYFGIIHAYEYKPYEKIYTKEEVLEICEGYLQGYMEKLSESGIQIIGKDGKIKQSVSGWKIEGTLTVIENIAREMRIGSSSPMPETQLEKQEEIQTEHERN